MSAAQPLRLGLGLVAAAGLAVAAVAEAMTRRELARRVRVALVPTESFEPSLEEALRFAAGLAGVRPAVGWRIPRQARAVRVAFEADEGGRLVMTVEAPGRCRGLIRSLGYREVEARPAPAARGGVRQGRGGRRRVRAEMRLARPPSVPLRQLALEPDPLTPLARAVEGLGEGEGLVVALDLLPVPRPVATRRRAKSPGGAREQLREVLWGPATRRGNPRREPRIANLDTRIESGVERTEARRAVDKVASVEATFEAQVLVAATSPARARARSHLRAALGAFRAYAGENHWRVVGQHLGLAFLGSDAPWRRRRFDRRLDTGRYRPARPALVTASEIAGWLKPPTRHCPVAAVLRSGGVVPPPPPGLPTWRDGAPLMPLGWISTDGGERAVGVEWDKTFFVLRCGRSRFGKTEAAMTAFLAAVRAGSGAMFVDPHRDALERMRPYLEGVADRVVEVDLSPRGRQALALGWNLLSMEGLGPDDVERRVAAVVDSFSAALHWGEVNTRAINLVTQAAQALCELALALPPALGPTIFQITTILSNTAWRNEVLPHLGPVSREFFESRFPRIDKASGEAITPVTNLIDRLRSSAAVAGMLGQSRSAYDIREAMDAGQVVLACPAGTGDKDRLIACFLVYDLLQAALSRRDQPPERRRPFRVWIDEMQVIDGASSGSLAALLEQAGKFGIRLEAMVQQPTRLTRTTLEALLNNRSHLVSTAVGSESAAVLAREWGGKVTPATVGSIEPYHFLASVTHDGAISAPFRVRGMTAEEAFGRPPAAGARAVDAALAVNLPRRPVGEVLDDLATLDARILAHLRSGAGPAPRRDRLRVVGQ